MQIPTDGAQDLARAGRCVQQQDLGLGQRRLPQVEARHRQNAVRLASNAERRQRTAGANVPCVEVAPRLEVDVAIPKRAAESLAQVIAPGGRPQHVLHQRRIVLFRQLIVRDRLEDRGRHAERLRQHLLIARDARSGRASLEESADSRAVGLLVVAIARVEARARALGVVGGRALFHEIERPGVSMRRQELDEIVNRFRWRARRSRTHDDEAIEATARVWWQRHTDSHSRALGCGEVHHPQHAGVDVADLSGRRARIGPGMQRRLDHAAPLLDHPIVSDVAEHQPTVGKTTGLGGARPHARAQVVARGEARHGGGIVAPALEIGGAYRRHDPGCAHGPELSRQHLPEREARAIEVLTLPRSR